MTSNEFVGARAVAEIRRDFPGIAAFAAAGAVYLDSAATAQRPQRVIDAERDYLAGGVAPVHRGASNATGESTNLFEEARSAVADFVGVAENEVVWALNATDAINMVSLGMADASAGLGGPAAARFALQPGDEIVVTEAEHHANLIPWQHLAKRTGAVLRAVPVDDRGIWTIDAFAATLSDRTRVVAVADVSNVTGAITDVAAVVELAHARGALVVLDACQSVPHRPTNFTELGVDFAAFSAHKMLGPNGLGVLVGRAELLNALPPARTGGSTITKVTLDDAEFLPSPLRFEAGTQAVSQVIALGSAVEYLTTLGMPAVAAHEQALAMRLAEQVAAMPGIRLVGPPPGAPRAGLVSVAVDGVHAHDVGQVLDSNGVIVRVGHHCAQPLHRALGLTATVRASAHVYTEASELDRFVEGLREVQRFFNVSGAAA